MHEVFTTGTRQVSILSNFVIHECAFMQLVPYGGRDVPANVSCEEVTLDSALRPGKSTVLETYSALAHQLKPRPKEILQGENQRVLLTAAQHTISPYPISSGTTEVRCISSVPLHLLQCSVHSCMSVSWTQTFTLLGHVKYTV